MENELHILNTGYAPAALSDSLLRSSFALLNPQLNSITGLPMFSPPFNSDANSSVVSLQQSELVFSYDYSSGFDGLFCDNVNDTKWDHNRPELNCGTSTSGFDQWVLPNYVTMDSSHPSSHNEHSESRSGLEHASNCRSHKFSTVISGSSYLAVLQQILSEIALESTEQRSYCTSLVSSNHFVDPRVSLDGGDDFFEDDGSFEARAESSYRRLELESKKSKLLGLLQMLDDCYNQCVDEIHTKTSALHAVAELDPQIHSSFALRTVTFFYKNLRDRISKQILAMESVDKGSTRDKERSFEKCFIQKRWALQQLKRRDQQLWRPQRGLPERSVSVLRTWMFENFLHPYPKDSEKHLLAIKSGLTRSQVSNWFINARVRLWKPLVEEMSTELNRRKGCRQSEEGSNRNAGENHQLSIYKHINQDC